MHIHIDIFVRLWNNSNIVYNCLDTAEGNSQLHRLDKDPMELLAAMLC